MEAERKNQRLYISVLHVLIALSVTGATVKGFTLTVCMQLAYSKWVAPRHTREEFADYTRLYLFACAWIFVQSYWISIVLCALLYWFREGCGAGAHYVHERLAL